MVSGYSDAAGSDDRTSISYGSSREPLWVSARRLGGFFDSNCDFARRYSRALTSSSKYSGVALPGVCRSATVTLAELDFKTPDLLR